MSEVILITDNSLSTKSYIKPYLNAINGVISIQRELAPNSLLSLITFNQKIREIYIRQRVSTLEPISEEKYNPNGMTALYDCLTRIISKGMQFRDHISSNPPLCVILTDGEDNASRQVDVRLTAIQIAIAKTRGWKFIFLGTNQNSMEIGRLIGCHTCILYEPTKTSLSKVVLTMKDLFQKPVENIDIDIRDLTNSISEMKI